MVKGSQAFSDMNPVNEVRILQFLNCRNLSANVLLKTTLDEIVLHEEHRHTKTLLKVLLVLESPFSHEYGLVLFHQVVSAWGDPFFLTAQYVDDRVTFRPGREKLFLDRAFELDDQVILSDDLVVTGSF